MHEVYWRRLRGGGAGEERLSPATAAPGWEQGPLPAYLGLLGCTQGEPLPRVAVGHMPSLLLLEVVHTPRCLDHQVAGRLVLLPVLDLAGSAERKVLLRGSTAKQEHSGSISIPGAKQ